MQKHRKLKIVLYAAAALIVVIGGYFLISGWIAGMPKLNYTLNTDAGSAAAYPDADFAVISDLHVYDPLLGTTGAAFETAMSLDRKLLRDSVELLDYAIGDILASNARFVLISGDMTKDGEAVCHAIAAEKLKRLTDAGIKVYVIPGNHDVSNPVAVSYSGDMETPVNNISPEEFAQIYANFGYGDALERDADSLSYVAEPMDGLWILAIDSCRYTENAAAGEAIVGGKISQTTADWIASVLQRAKSEQKAVITIMHHGVVEHWDGQRKLHEDYIISDYAHFGEFLASYDVRLAFTGHYHALDIVRGDFNDKYIYDVETGSLITAPCPIRYCSIKGGEFEVNSETIVAKLRPGTDFAPESAEFVKTTVVLEAKKTLGNYFVGGEDAEIIGDAVGDAFTAHYSGDEDPAKRPALDESRLSLWGRFVLGQQKYVLDGLWNDPAPNDVNARFELK